MKRFRHNQLPADELLALDDHLKECPDCRARADGRTVHAIGSALTGISGNHLSYEELEGLADGSLSSAERSRCEEHLGACPECRSEVELYRSLATAEPRESEKSVRPDRFRRWFTGPFVPVAVAAAVLVGLGVFLWFSSSPKKVELADVVTDGPDTNAVVVPSPSVSTDLEPPSNGNSRNEVQLTVSLDDAGQKVGLDEAGNLAGLNSAPARYRSLLKDALHSGRLPVADNSDLRTRPSATMGDSAEPNEAFETIGPAGRVVDTPTPTLSWRPLAGADGYTAEVFDENYNRVASSGKITSNSWSTRLPRGRTFVWQVTAYKNGREIKAPRRPAPEARFRILDAARSAEIGRLKDGGSHLLLALAYSEAGLFDEAEREMRRVVSANPQSKLAMRFLEQIRGRR